MSAEENFRKRMKILRVSKGLNQAELAALCGHGWRQAKVSLIEVGGSHVTLADAVKVAAALDVPLETLISDGELTVTVKL